MNKIAEFQSRNNPAHKKTVHLHIETITRRRHDSKKWIKMHPHCCDTIVSMVYTISVRLKFWGKRLFDFGTENKCSFRFQTLFDAAVLELVRGKTLSALRNIKAIGSSLLTLITAVWQIRICSSWFLFARFLWHFHTQFKLNLCNWTIPLIHR